MQRPYTALDLCGVIKRPVAPPGPSPPVCGTAKLNQQGCAVIALPPSFRPPQSYFTLSEQHPLTFLVTPLGAPMPNLHVARELFRSSSSAALEEDGKQGAVKGMASAGSKECLSQTGVSKGDREREEDKVSDGAGSGAGGGNGSKRSATNLSSLGSADTDAAAAQASQQKHNDRLIDGPLPRLPSILSAEKALSAMGGAGLAASAASNGSGEASGAQEVGAGEVSGQNSSHSQARARKGQANKRGAAGVGITYCFSVAGGRAGGKICWQVCAASCLLSEGQNESSRSPQEDWRSI